MQHLSANMPESLRGLVDLAFWAHLRLGELLALRIGDIDMAGLPIDGTLL